MLIRRVEVFGLLGRKTPIFYEFNSDLNIATGKNGAGKTTLLKLMWYIISGNITQALQEIEFQKVVIATSLYKVTVHKIGDYTCRVEYDDTDGSKVFEDVSDDEGDIILDARDLLRDQIGDVSKSLFFPTFRRIEGGFTIPGRRGNSSAFFNSPRGKNELQEAVGNISRRLSQFDHTFITSVSTADIAELLLKRYTEMSEEASSVQRQMSQSVVDRIKEYKRETYEDAGSPELAGEAETVLDNIRSMIENTERDRKQIMTPWIAVQNLASKLLNHAGIQINNRISFGDAARAINSDTLSAGEKQMLSFICYNALTEDTIIFIDEPELSLHVDWQRLLFPTLLEQGKRNQFIIATHSPFIYSKYPEKEIRISENRGASNLEF